ncbi:MAG TPA: hypothetical protein VEX15_13210 [Nocardioidaceae bacterium]|nr:hypothetical protein [Nocardioidaceae bacterium]
MTTQVRSLIGALVGLGLILVAGCSDDSNNDSIDTQGWTSQGVIETFAEGNVPADYVGPLSEYEPSNSALKDTDDASSFHASWFDFDTGSIRLYHGRVFVFDHLDPLREIESYYKEDHGHTWVFTNEACGILVQLNSKMTAYWANQYEEVVQNIC